MSHTSQELATGEKVESTVLPPFSEKLRADKKLELSDGDFKQSIEEYYGNKQLSATDQLTETPPFPTPHVLAQFAKMAYLDCTREDPKPPDGWQLLTTASNTEKMNGYFGTAYWHPEYQQVVIAHRGTDVKNCGSLVTDVSGVLFNNYVPQMSSASTFANKVVAVLQEIEQEKKVIFEVFFTGHSLGGWLAQITTFTTKYLEVRDSHEVHEGWLAHFTAFITKTFKGKSGIFLSKQKPKKEESPASSTEQDSHDIRNGYHPHAVVFDSPGCKGMLLLMADKLDVRLKGSSINLQHLDITSYLSAPNCINTCNSHLGTVYRIFIDLSGMGWKERNTPLYNLATHSMDKIVDAFDPETGLVRKNDKDELKIEEVVDWPLRAGKTYGSELKDFFNKSKYFNNYQPDVKPKDDNNIRYQTNAFNECTRSLRVFTHDEREFLQHYFFSLELKKIFKFKDSFSLLSNADDEEKAQQKLQNFELDNESISCPDATTLHTLVPYVKRLVRLFPHIKKEIKDKLSSSEIINKVRQDETRRYVKQIQPNALEFNAGALGLKEFLDTDQKFG